MCLFLLDDGDVEIIGARAWFMGEITNDVSNPTGVILGTVYAFGLKLYTDGCLLDDVITHTNHLSWQDEIFVLVFL
jgi:hypothetical protein